MTCTIDGLVSDEPSSKRMVGTVWLPFHFSGHWQGVDLKAYYPDGAAPVIRGEAVNTATTYGYDSVTMMQETKTTVCQVERAA